MKRFFCGVSALVFFLAASCSKNNPADESARAFFDTYAERNNFDEFLSFFAEEAELLDMINGDHIKGKNQLREFFDWQNPNLKKIREKSLTLEDLIVKDNKAIGSGHFSRFQWGTHTFGPMQFTIVLEFDTDGKIIKETDWINYPSNLIDYSNRKDSNAWISEEN